MELRTQRLILRPWSVSDAESLYKYASNPNVGPIAGWRVHTSVENSREIIENVLSAKDIFAIVLPGTNEPIGSIGIMMGGNSNLDIGEDEGEMGFWIGEQFWGQGYITEAAKKVLEYAFDDLMLKAVWCGYFEGNTKSKRVQEKCGFIYHHTNYDIYWQLLDELKTEHVSSITREQWKAASH